MSPAEEAKTQVGDLRRTFRDMMDSINAALEGRRPSADCVRSIRLIARNRSLFAMNSPPAQPMREFLRTVTERQKLMHTVMTPDFWLLAFKQEAATAQAESERLLEEFLETV